MAAKKRNKYAAKPKELQKRFMLCAYCTEDQKKEFYALAEKKGVTVSDLIMSLVNHCVKVANEPVEVIQPPEEANHHSAITEAQERAKKRAENPPKMGDPVFNGNICHKCTGGMFDAYIRGAFPFDPYEMCMECGTERKKTEF